jgi:hypothetical protein
MQATIEFYRKLSKLISGNITLIPLVSLRGLSILNEDHEHAKIHIHIELVRTIAV